MSTRSRTLRLAAWLALAGGVLGLGPLNPIRGEEEGRPKVTPSARGGTLVTTERHEFEVFFYKTGVRVFSKSTADPPADPPNPGGTVTFRLPGVPRPYIYPLKGATSPPSLKTVSLDLGIDLSRVPTAGTEVAIELTGLDDLQEDRASFTLPFRLVPPPKPPAPVLVAVKATQGEQSSINAQRVCPVSGEPLGSAGTPIKVLLGARSAYLCCEGCLKEVRANPDKFLAPPAGRTGAKESRKSDGLP
jgi:hypothetical protein